MDFVIVWSNLDKNLITAKKSKGKLISAVRTLLCRKAETRVYHIHHQKKTVVKTALFLLFAEKKVIKYVEQYVTTLVMIYSPTVNDTHYPLGTATTCPANRCAQSGAQFPCALARARAKPLL